MLFANRLFSQADSLASGQRKFLIVSITVTGNKHTRAEVITREMQTKVDQEATASQLELDRRRIESLGLFHRVEMELYPDGIGYNLEIIVSEKWYLFPYPVIFFNDRDYKLSKLSFGAGISHMNFRGRAEIIQATGWLGYNPTIALGYSNPWIFGNARFFARINSYFADKRSLTYDLRQEEISERQVSFGGMVGKRLTLRTSLALGLNYREMRFRPIVPGQTLDPSGRDRLLETSLVFTNDQRDLISYPIRGWFLMAQISKTGFPRSRYINYGRVQFDVRKYVALGKATTLAMHFATNVSYGLVPIYNRVFFGYGQRIRGYYTERYEAENSMVAQVEFRFPIIPIRYLNMPNKVLGAFGQNLKFGISAGIFIDSGTLWLQDRSDRPDPQPFTGPFAGQTRPRKWLTGFGAGIHIHLPYVDLVRLEVAVNENLRAEFIFDTRVAF